MLTLLPEVITFTREAFDEMRRRLDKEVGPAWLIHFVNADVGDSLHYKKISAFIPRQRLGKVPASDAILYLSLIGYNTHL